MNWGCPVTGTDSTRHLPSEQGFWICYLGRWWLLGWQGCSRAGPCCLAQRLFPETPISQLPLDKELAAAGVLQPLLTSLGLQF